jgi:hypothetical protein
MDFVNGILREWTAYAGTYGVALELRWTGFVSRYVRWRLNKHTSAYWSRDLRTCTQITYHSVT